MKPARLVALVAMTMIVGGLLAIPFVFAGMTVRQVQKEFQGTPANAAVTTFENLGAVAGTIVMNGPIDLVWKKADATRVTFAGPKDVVSWCKAEVRDGAVLISVEDGKRWYGTVTATVMMPQPTNVESLGSGDLRLDDLEGGNLNVLIKGSSDCGLDGSLESLRLTIEGSGDVDATDLETDKVEASIAGSGDIDLGEVKELTAAVTGSGSVEYDRAEKVQSSVLGSGSVRAR